MREAVKVACPTCGKPVVRSAEAEAPYFPFCSERCRLVDLGKWLDESHRIEEPLERGPDAGPARKEEDEGGLGG